MAKQETKTEKLEREYIIPLRREFEKVPRYRRANKAISAIKKFLVQHMAIRDRDVRKIRIDRYLNEYVWFRGIRKPPVKIKIKAIKEKDKDGKEIVRVELAEMPETLKFKKAREEKADKKGENVSKKKQEEKTEETTKEETHEQTEEKKEEKKEKEGATEEAAQIIDKQTAKAAKHQSVEKVRPLKRQFRQALQK